MNLTKKVFSSLILFSELTTLLWAFEDEDVDITKDANETVVEIFESFYKINPFDELETVVTIGRSPTTRPALILNMFEVASHSFQKLETLEVYSEETSLLYWFNSKKVNLQTSRLTVAYNGYVSAIPNGESPKYFVFKFSMINCSIHAITSLDADTSEPLYDPSWLPYEGGDLHVDFVRNLPLEVDIRSLVRKIFRYNYIWNKFYSRNYDSIKPKKHSSKRASYSAYNRRNYFLVPNISIGSIDLTNTILRYFPDICYLNKTDQSRTVTMILKGFSGKSRVRKILHLGAKVKTVELTWDFYIKSLSVTVNQETNEIVVEAGMSSFQELLDGINTDYSGSGAVHLIEYAIASAIMPSMKFVDRNSTLSASISEVERYFTQSSSTISNIDNESTQDERMTESTRPQKPSDTYSKTIDESTREPAQDQHTTTTEPHSGPITINNYYLTINVLPGNGQFPQHIQCPVLNNSTLTHRINLEEMFGKKYQAYGGPKNIDINFHFNLPSLNISINKPPILNCSSNVNGSCEFQIRNDQDIKVEVSSLTTNLSSSHPSNEVLKIEKQLNATLLSMIKERIVRTIKPAICIPYDFCSQSVKMVDDFFQGFINDVLRRCSLLKKNETTLM